MHRDSICRSARALHPWTRGAGKQALARDEKGALMGFVRQAIKQLATATVPRRMLMDRGASSWMPAIGAGRSGRGATTIALTFDDGPHPERTPRVLDVLAEHRVHATFFVIGAMAREHPDLVRRLVAEGHEIGNHTYTHASLEHTSPQQLRTEVEMTRALLEDLTGRACPLLRPPWGKVSTRALFQLWSGGHSVILWSADPRDYAMKSAEAASAWCARYRPCNGDIILLHDPSSVTDALVRELVEHTSRQGIQFSRISQYIP
ncbi:polysaccharide deacetylase family protein [Sorangium sp. So ce375]|jgi:peptidoglycan-N-acetylglucosamine deacetylase|uniref:polysaccharide deacetylase family protein n=1 Tax=Sorangium sp. So ce375 TaxID=3133306 RepID=UPI003F5B7F8F